MNDEQSNLTNPCPHCSYNLSVPVDTPGINCPACDQRVIIRGGVFLTIEQAQSFGAQNRQAHSTNSPTQSQDQQPLINKANFDPRYHVAEYKRTCRNCNKVWHSLVNREKVLEKRAQCEICSACGDNSAQHWRNRDALKSTLDDIRKCPQCSSTNYKEVIQYHAK